MKQMHLDQICPWSDEQMAKVSAEVIHEHDTLEHLQPCTMFMAMCAGGHCGQDRLWKKHPDDVPVQVGGAIIRQHHHRWH